MDVSFGKRFELVPTDETVSNRPMYKFPDADADEKLALGFKDFFRRVPVSLINVIPYGEKTTPDIFNPDRAGPDFIKSPAELQSAKFVYTVHSRRGNMRVRESKGVVWHYPDTPNPFILTGEDAPGIATATTKSNYYSPPVPGC